MNSPVADESSRSSLWTFEGNICTSAVCLATGLGGDATAGTPGSVIGPVSSLLEADDLR